MIYKFVFSSEEVEGFRCTLEADGDASFLELHKALLEAVHYTDDQMPSFFLCDDEWERDTEITRVDMGYDDEKCLVMEDAYIADVIPEVGQRLMYVFDTINDRYFIARVKTITEGSVPERVRCIECKGTPPVQLQMPMTNKKGKGADDITSDMGEDFYGSEDYDVEDLDMDSFQDVSFEDGTMF